MADVFFWVMVVITVLFWLDLFIPDPLPFIDEIILFVLMVFGWIIYGIMTIVKQGASVVSFIFHPIGIMIGVSLLILFLIYKFNLLDVQLPKRRKKR
jgi:hypothetical protein